MKSKLTGLVAAPFTPMQENGAVNLELIPRQARLLAADGVSGAFICGTTGEGASLTVEERLRIAEAWVAAIPKSMRLVVHVGHNSIEDSCRLAAHAEQIGAYAIATIAPSFFRPATVEQLASFCGQIAGEASSLPFYFYHMPGMTGVNFAMIDFLRIAGRQIPNLAGIKFTHENLMDYAQCLQFEEGRYDILFGRDEILLAALALGATGAVGSTYNYMVPVYQQLLLAFKSGNLEAARSQQMKAIEIIAVMIRHGGMPAGKAMMKLAGIDCGPVRSPLRALTAEETDALFRDLERVGFRSTPERKLEPTHP